MREWTRNEEGQDKCVACLRGETFAGDRCELCGEGKYSLLAGESFFGCHQCPGKKKIKKIFCKMSSFFFFLKKSSLFCVFDFADFFFFVLFF